MLKNKIILHDIKKTTLDTSNIKKYISIHACIFKHKIYLNNIEIIIPENGMNIKTYLYYEDKIIVDSKGKQVGVKKTRVTDLLKDYTRLLTIINGGF